jgi:hypothetical protein
VLELSPFVNPKWIVLSNQESPVTYRSAAPSAERRGQLRAIAVDAGAFFADLRGARQVKMQGQEKNKQQNRCADETAKFTWFLASRIKHAGNLAYSISDCQRLVII